MPHSRLVFTWETPWSAPATTVTISLHPVAEGTRVELTHVRFLSEESRDNHAKGWAGMLVNLELALARQTRRGRLVAQARIMAQPGRATWPRLPRGRIGMGQGHRNAKGRGGG